jgi:hypothetical protein
VHRDPRRTARERVDAYARGVTHLARGDELAALDAFREYLRGADLDQSRRQEAEKYSIALGRKFAEIEVICEAAGATITLDGRQVGHTPLTRSLFLLPGTHQLVVAKDGYRPLSKTFRVAGGERKPFPFHLDR